MKNPLRYIGNNILLNLLRIIFGSVFILSGVLKIFNFADFIKAVRDFELLPTFIVPIFSYSLPIIELILGLGLIVNFKPSLISNLLTYLVAIFTAVLVSKLIEGVQINCACFGNFSNSKIDFATITRNVLLLSLGALLTIYLPYNQSNIKNNKSTKNLKQFTLNNVFQILLTTTVVFLVVQVTILSQHNKLLINRIRQLMNTENILLDGARVSTINVKDIYGNEKILLGEDQLSKITALYLFTTNCNICDLNMSRWINLCRELKEEGVNIYSITRDPLKNINIEIVKVIKSHLYLCNDTNFVNNYKAALTPQLILINKEKEVIKVIPGLLDKFKIAEIHMLINS